MALWRVTPLLPFQVLAKPFNDVPMPSPMAEPTPSRASLSYAKLFAAVLMPSHVAELSPSRAMSSLLPYHHMPCHCCLVIITTS